MKALSCGAGLQKSLRAPRHRPVFCLQRSAGRPDAFCTFEFIQKVARCVTLSFERTKEMIKGAVLFQGTQHGWSSWNQSWDSGGKKINNPGRIPATGTGAAFHQELWQTSIYLFKSQSISLLFIFAGDPMYRCRCCLARAMASGDGRS